MLNYRSTWWPLAAQSDGELFIVEQSLIQCLNIRERLEAEHDVRCTHMWNGPLLFKIEENFVAREWIRRNWGQVMGEAYS